MISDWLADCSDIFIHAEKMGRIKYPVGIKMGRIFSKMSRILSDLRPLFQALGACISRVCMLKACGVLNFCWQPELVQGMSGFSAQATFGNEIWKSSPRWLTVFVNNAPFVSSSAASVSMSLLRPASNASLRRCQKHVLKARHSNSIGNYWT